MQADPSQVDTRQNLGRFECRHLYFRPSLRCSCQTVVDLPAPHFRRAVFQCVRRRSFIAAITVLDEFVRARLPTALRARKGAGCVRCRTRPHWSVWMRCAPARALN